MIKSLFVMTLSSVLPVHALNPPPPVEAPPKIVKTWKCPDCSPEEKFVLAQLQKHTMISDRNALATILGNIKQESNFTPNICEGGARVEYQDCHVGGYGLIQWTSESRYVGLGIFSARYGLNPSTFDAQLRYMSNEYQFQRALLDWQIPGRTYEEYHAAAYRWLGWGVEGPRKTYTYNYLDRLSKVSDEKVQSTSSDQKRLGYLEKILGVIGIKV